MESEGGKQPIYNCIFLHIRIDLSVYAGRWALFSEQRLLQSKKRTPPRAAESSGARTCPSPAELGVLYNRKVSCLCMRGRGPASSCVLKGFLWDDGYNSSWLCKQGAFPQCLLSSCHYWNTGIQLKTITNHKRFLPTLSSMTLLIIACRWDQPWPSHYL